MPNNLIYNGVIDSFSYMFAAGLNFLANSMLVATNSAIKIGSSMAIRTVTKLSMVSFAPCVIALVLTCSMRFPFVRTRFLKPIFSMLIAGFTVKYPDVSRAKDHRSEFRKFQLVPPLLKTNCPHPDISAMRDAANFTCINFARQALVRPIISIPRMFKDPSTCKARVVDVKDTIRNVRYFATDLVDNHDTSHVTKIIDLDNQMDMHDLLLDPGIFLLYSFNPSRAGLSESEYSFTIEKDTFTLLIQGNLKITGKVWDYSNEVINVRVGYCANKLRKSNWFLRTLFEFPANFCDWVTGLETLQIYTCERRASPYGNPNWDLVYLHHACTVVVTDSLFDKEVLRTKVFGNDQYSCVIHQRTVSIAPSGTATSIDLPLDDVNSVIANAQLDKTIVKSGIERLLLSTSPGSKVAARQAVFLTGYLKSLGYILGPAVDNSTYGSITPLALEELKPSMRQVLKPYTTLQLAPASSFNNDNWTVLGRLQLVRNPNKFVPERYWLYSEEFVTLLVPNRHQLVPWSEEQVCDEQNRPPQKALYDQMRNWLHYTGTHVSAFMKREAYQKISDPRNISTVPEGHKKNYSRYTYAFKHGVMKDQNWYAFGCDPKTLAKRVNYLARYNTHITDADLSRQDGRKGYFHQYVWLMCLLAAFDCRYHSEVTELFEEMLDARGTTKHGVKYMVGSSQLSGQPSTTDSNTISNCIAKYITYREQGYSSSTSFDLLGLYGGDDSLDGDKLDIKVLTEVCLTMGDVVKVSYRKRGEVVPFLGRLFVDPWTTTVMIADIKRQYCKLGLTTAPIEVPKQLCLRRKAESLIISDPNTPILSQWAHAVLRNTEENLVTKLQWSDASYLTQLFPAHESWPQEDPDLDLLISVAADNLSITPEEVRALMEFYDNIDDFSELDHGCLMTYPFTTPVTIEFAGEIWYGQAPAELPSVDPMSKQSRNARRRAAKRAKKCGGNSHI